MVFSTDFPPKEGIGNHVHHLARKLVEWGHEVTLVTRGSPYRTRKYVVDGIELFRVPFIPLYPFHVRIHGIPANSLIRSLEPDLDIVHLHHAFPPLIRTSLPTIVTVHTPMREKAQWHRHGIDFHLIARKIILTACRPQELELLRNSDMVTAVSESIARMIEKELGIGRDQIPVVGNGVDENIFKPIRNRHQENRYVLYTGCSLYEAEGGSYYRKGLYDLVMCAKHVCQQYSDVRFVLTGHGPLLGRLQQVVRDAGLQHSFSFVGYVSKENLIRLYQNATVYVTPSYYEGLPTALLEAMACGLPVVATAVSGNTDLISPNNNGLLVPPRAPRQMAGAISRFLRDDDLRERVGGEARRTIEEHYTWNRVAARILKCYESLL